MAYGTSNDDEITVKKEEDDVDDVDDVKLFQLRILKCSKINDHCHFTQRRQGWHKDMIILCYNVFYMRNTDKF